jgi:serine O-acetyltransferase
MKEIIKKLENATGLLKGMTGPKVSLEDIDHTLVLFKKSLFPGVFHKIEHENKALFLESTLYELQFNLKSILSKLSINDIELITKKIMHQLPQLKQWLYDDINAIYNGDPAANSYEEVLLAYPSFEAIMIHRIAHELSKLNLNLLARMCASIAHRKTGVDIHPKAKIGHSFCIDHGTGIVIGETAEIGDFVKLYQGVTIGALSVSKKQKNKKRHPTIEDHVTIYARTTILGGNTVIGKHSIIGGNVWLVTSVPEYSKIYAKESTQ